MKNEVNKIIKICVEEVIKNWDIQTSHIIDDNFPIFNKESDFSSINVVSLIINLEEEINNNFKKSIILANDKAFSAVNSPFKNIKSLTEYIYELLS